MNGILIYTSEKNGNETVLPVFFVSQINGLTQNKFNIKNENISTILKRGTHL